MHVCAHREAPEVMEMLLDRGGVETVLDEYSWLSSDLTFMPNGDVTPLEIAQVAVFSGHLCISCVTRLYRW